MINIILKPTIISISMATVMAKATISPALGLIAKAFPDASPTMIKHILKAPSIMIGLFIYLIGGIVSQFVSMIELLLIFRLLLGAGVDLLMPLAMSRTLHVLKSNQQLSSTN